MMSYQAKQKPKRNVQEGGSSASTDAPKKLKAEALTDQPKKVKAEASTEPPKKVKVEAPRKPSKRKRSKSPDPETLREIMNYRNRKRKQLLIMILQYIKDHF